MGFLKVLYVLLEMLPFGLFWYNGHQNLTISTQMRHLTWSLPASPGKWMSAKEIYANLWCTFSGTISPLMLAIGETIHLIGNHRISWVRQDPLASLSPTPGFPAQSNPKNPTMCLNFKLIFFMNTDWKSIKHIMQGAVLLHYYLTLSILE